MLPSTLDNLAWSLRQHVLRTSPHDASGPPTVLDVGGALDAAAVRHFFSGLGWRWISTERCDEIDDDSVDVVVSVRILERTPAFWEQLGAMARVCRRDGVIIVVTASATGEQPAHGPLFRFSAAAFAALAERFGLTLVECRDDPRGPSHDLVVVLRKQAVPPVGDALPPALPPPAQVSDHLMKLAPATVDETIDFGRGSEDYLALMARIHDDLDPSFYLEIGVDTGVSLVLAGCPAVGIDPAPDIGPDLAPHHRLNVCTSDDYFRLDPGQRAIPPIDLAFIDGMHLIENAFMDFLNVERHCSPWSLIIIDDVFPSHPAQARRDRATRFWTGDVWKIMTILRDRRPDLFVLGVDTAPTGLLLVIGADAANDALWRSFDDLVTEAIDDQSDPPDHILDRRDCLDPTDPLLARLMRHLADCRRRGTPPDVARLRELVVGAMPRKVAASR